ncbi:MAG: hypothetical protein AAF539_11570 [Planctomycetota bacterium]
MSCSDLAERLSDMRPDLTSIEVARLCLMLLQSTPNPSELSDPEVLQQAWRQASFRLETATDQHDAVVTELESLFGDEPVAFTPDQLWLLLRAVKVQGQLLELYTNQPSLT